MTVNKLPVYSWMLPVGRIAPLPHEALTILLRFVGRILVNHLVSQSWHL